ncbi:MAG: hypothetical protein C5B50_27450 [Verrucomicrobia bacterium]|nr:MAG: hypothetical protein C5B50_27450 [Verrucomicrobiota bacterium]
MRDRIEPALRILCVGLGGLLLVQLALRVPHLFPLQGVQIPALPALAAAEIKTNAPSDKEPAASVSSGSTNQASRNNATTTAATKGNQTNSPVSGKATPQTNNAAQSTVAHTQTGPTGPTGPTNGPVAAKLPLAGSTSHSATTNLLAAHTTNSSSPSVASLSSSNKPAGSASNLVAKTTNDSKPREAGGRPGGRPGGPGAKPIELTPVAQAEVDRIVDSEMLGPVFHPMPLALLGIAGDMAFLRASSGQSGAVKEGDSLGAIKLVRIGINRVLVEEDGQKKELMIFEGTGGESLMPK